MERKSKKEKIGRNPPIAGTARETSPITILLVKNRMAKILTNPAPSPKIIRFSSGKVIPNGIKNKQRRNHRIPT